MAFKLIIILSRNVEISLTITTACRIYFLFTLHDIRDFSLPTTLSVYSEKFNIRAVSVVTCKMVINDLHFVFAKTSAFNANYKSGYPSDLVPKHDLTI